jgi:hypothetical protein
LVQIQRGSNQPTTNASQYYTYRAKLRKKKWVKLSIGADMLKQIICTITIRRAPTTRHDDNVDFKPILTTAAQIKPLLSIVVADKGYDSSEENHELIRDKLHAYSMHNSTTVPAGGRTCLSGRRMVAIENNK